MDLPDLKHDNPTRRTVYLICLASALFLLGCAGGAWLLGDGLLATWLLRAVMVYAALLLSFHGGLHWGLTLKDSRADSRTFLIGVAPSVLALAAMLMPMRPALMLLAVGYVAQLIVDLVRLKLPGWFRTLWAAMTVAVVMALILALIAAIQ
ncbi:MAG: DUF3429 domain-containing protein [Aquisalimonadaceae bacterium]